MVAKLRALDAGGVLADDMGLGKTLQAIAHLYVEKQQGRMDRPSLVVVPTSLCLNWQRSSSALPQVCVRSCTMAKGVPQSRAIGAKPTWLSRFTQFYFETSISLGLSRFTSSFSTRRRR